MAVRPLRAAGLIAGCAVLAGIAVGPATAQVIDGPSGSGRATVDGNTPAWATPSHKTGKTDTHQRRHVQIALPMRDQAGAQALATAVSTPNSPLHSKFLTATQFNTRYAPTQSSVDQVTAWLRSQGLRVDQVAANRHFIDATGTVGQLETAFATSLANFHVTVKGHILSLAAPEKPVTVPAAVRPAIQAVLGLDDSSKTVSPAQSMPRNSNGARPSVTPAAGDPQSCASYWGAVNNPNVPQQYPSGSQSNALCGYRYNQIRALYGLSGSNTGAGQTAGIVGAYNLATAEADTNRAASMFGAPTLTAGQYSAVLPPAFDHQTECGPDSWAGEQALDIQAIHTTAPAAKIVYYAATSCLGLYEALNKAVSDDTVSLINNSWLYPGESTVPQAEIDQLNSIAIQAAIQGQVLSFASGDSGDNSAPTAAGKPEASFPASSPWVTAVGGTSAALDGSNRITFQTGWENTGNVQQGNEWVQEPTDNGKFAGGAGGGVSSLYDEPDYQKGVVPDAVAQGHRAVPDISALADAYTGLAIGFTSQQGFLAYSSGGTSLASPLLIGLVADAQQSQGVQMGFLNTALYSMKSGISDVTPVKAGVWSPFMDSFGHVPVPSQAGSYLLDLDSRPQSLQSAQGWDAVTGVGTPSAGFVTALGH